MCVCAGGLVIGALQVHQKKGGYYELVVLAVRPVGFRFLFGSPDLQVRSELLLVVLVPCFTGDAYYKLGRGTRCLELILWKGSRVYRGYVQELRVWRRRMDHYDAREV